MEPEVFLGGEVGERIEVIDGAGVDGARGPQYADGAQSRGAVGGDQVAHRRDIDAEIPVHRHDAVGITPHAHEFQALGDPAVHLRGAIDGEPRLTVEAVLPEVEPRLRVAPDREADDVRHSAAARHDAARARGEAHHLGEPLDHLQFDQFRRLVHADRVHVHAGGEHVGHHAERRAVRLHPTPESRVAVAGGVGQYMREELGVHLLGALRCGGERLTGDRRCDVRRRRRPGRTLAQAREVIEAVVDHAVGEGTEGLPILRIEGEVGVGGRGGAGVESHPVS